MNDIFDKIISREIPAQFVYEDDTCIVVMDKFPVVEGQVLIIPKDCVDYLFDLEEKSYGHIMALAKRVVKALDITYGTIRTCIVIEGFEVPHAHVKLYPLTKREFHIHGGAEADDEALRQGAAKIKANFA